MPITVGHDVGVGGVAGGSYLAGLGQYRKWLAEQQLRQQQLDRQSAQQQAHFGLEEQRLEMDRVGKALQDEQFQAELGLRERQRADELEERRRWHEGQLGVREGSLEERERWHNLQNATAQEKLAGARELQRAKAEALDVLDEYGEPVFPAPGPGMMHDPDNERRARNIIQKYYEERLKGQWNDATQAEALRVVTRQLNVLNHPRPIPKPATPAKVEGMSTHEFQVRKEWATETRRIQEAAAENDTTITADEARVEALDHVRQIDPELAEKFREEMLKRNEAALRAGTPKEQAQEQPTAPGVTGEILPVASRQGRAQEQPLSPYEQALLVKWRDEALAHGLSGADIAGYQKERLENDRRFAAEGAGVIEGVAAPPVQAAAAPIPVKTKAEYDALPPGTRYVDPNGVVGIKR